MSLKLHFGAMIKFDTSGKDNCGNTMIEIQAQTD